MRSNKITRRKFLHTTAVTSGLGIVQIGYTGIANKSYNERQNREVWIAGVSQMNLSAKDPDNMVDQILGILEGIKSYKPDFVCLPETFPFNRVEKQSTPDEKVLISERTLIRFSEFSRKNNCYTICPVYTRRDGKIFNAAVVLDREGNRTGSYEKIHLADYEINDGFTCGNLLQPAIKTEFGPIGIQICYDIEWDDGWTMLRKQGANIIFWPSAFEGGKCVNTKAWEHKCVVSSATIKNTAKLCDISGEVIAQTGIWNANLFCAPVNLEKAFIPTWPAVEHFPEIQKKYGRKVKITNFHEEEWTILESLSPEISVKDILKEFGLKSHEQIIAEVELLQVKSRK